MASLKEAQEITKKFTKEFFNLKGVHGTGTRICDCCNKPYIHVSLLKDTPKSVLEKIPNNYEGLKVVKQFSPMTVAQDTPVTILKTTPEPEASDTQKNKFKKEFEGKDNYVINITKKGTNAIINAPTIGGYIPQDIGVLMEVMNIPKTVKELKNSERKYENLEGLLIYLHSKGLIAINGIVSPKANDLSSADGDDFSNAGGRRRSSPRRAAPRRRVAPRRSSNQGGARRHVNYVRRNYNRFYAVPYAVTPVAYFYDVQHPKRIVITKKGLEYIKKHNKGAYPYFLSAIKTGNVYDEGTLKNSLKLGDWNRIVGWLYGNKLIDFV